MPFHWVEENLRQSFRILAAAKARGDVLDLTGVTVASSGVTFQMFNAAFLNSPVQSLEDLEARLETVYKHFQDRGMPWSFWFCEDWLSRAAQRRLSRVCEKYGLRQAAEMPGMAAEQIESAGRKLPEMEYRLVTSKKTLDDFRAIGSTCFHVPIDWFSEVFDDDLAARQGFACWVGYYGGIPVATAASVMSVGAIGLYNIATLPGHRQRGYGEAITRYAIGEQQRDSGVKRIVLQSTAQGRPLYERMGFQSVTRILVYNSR